MTDPTPEHPHSWVDFGQGPICQTCRKRFVPDSLADEQEMVVLNPSAIGNPSETPVVFVGDTFESVWPSGVGGAQCDECDQITIVRGFGSDFMGMRERWLCRACAEGFEDDYYEGDTDG